MAKQLEKVYDPKSVEDSIYAFWLKGGYFHAQPNTGKTPYTIVIPPPNITGQLHMGHAMDNTLQDVLIRWRRMQGYEALWMPGTDHASIATEARIVAAMAEEGLTKDAIGREAFLERAWEWKRIYGGRIVEQLKKLGSSCDWERERFTMDEGCNKAVVEVFVRLYEKGLIYQGERIINWCPTCLTSISDAEVEYQEENGHFWHIKYPIEGNGDYLEVATTRPETMLGDTALAVHPDDKRYQKYIGQYAILPLVNRKIPIIADTYVEMDFGSGVVKITPAHDPNDFEVGLRHSLPVIRMMNDDATVNENGGVYAGLGRYEARKQVVADLEAQGLLCQVKKHVHNVGSCYRCSTTVEPIVSRQWFVKMAPLAQPAIAAVKEDKIKFVPQRFDKIYHHWMENIRDWCISRQLWWGHRIPAWYCGDCGQVTVAREAVTACAHCDSHSLRQDEDTLDTWFSSGLWPFSTLGWPEDTPELRYFYPTSTLVTGYDIIFFWVARMIVCGLELMEDIPFDTVYIHGIIRDAQGRKMSKSLGNGIDPLEIIDQYGADALRLTLISGNSAGNDMRFSDEKVKASRNFANKIWNAARFILMNLGEAEIPLTLPAPAVLATEDKWVLRQYNRLVKDVTDNLERFELGVAAGKLYDFIWDIFCDWYIELTKPRLLAADSNPEAAGAARSVLCYVMSHTLTLLHPFMPFITEEIWQALPRDQAVDSLMMAPWPVWDASLDFAQEADAFEHVMEVIRGVRNLRAEMNIPPSQKCSLFIETETPSVFTAGESFLRRLACADRVEAASSFPHLQAGKDTLQVITPAARVLIPMDELVDKEKELARLQKEKVGLEKDIAIISGKLENPGFLAKAPAALVEGERQKLAAAREKLAKVETGIAGLA